MAVIGLSEDHYQPIKALMKTQIYRATSPPLAGQFYFMSLSLLLRPLSFQPCSKSRLFVLSVCCSPLSARLASIRLPCVVRNHLCRKEMFGMAVLQQVSELSGKSDASAMERSAACVQ